MKFTFTEAREYLNMYLHQNMLDSPEKREWKRVYDAMSIHMDGLFPDRLIKTRRPMEDEQRFNYRWQNYEPITNGIIQEAIDGLFRIFNENNYQLYVSESLERYIYGNNFNGNDFISYIQDMVIVNMIRDPNSIVVVLPGGQGLVNDNMQVEPQVLWIPSCNIIEKCADYVIFISPERTKLKNGRKYEYTGKIVYLLDRYSVYISKQTGKADTNKHDYEELYSHGFGEVPYTTLGGIWNQTNNCYESYFKSFLPFANECIRQYSDWQGIMVTSAYPIREIRHVGCRNPECMEGYVYRPGTHTPSHVCPSCNGTGKEIAMGPYGAFVQDDYNPAIDGSGGADKPPIRFHSPPTDIIEYSQSAWEALYMKSRQALHLDMIDEAQSGTAKAIDREREYAMILKISNNIFDNIMYQALYYMERYMNPQLIKIPEIVKPTEFSLKSEKNLLEDLALMKEKGAPDSIIREISKEVIKKRYFSNDMILKSNMFLADVDKLYFKSQAEKMELLGTGIITEEDIAFNLEAPRILANMMRGAGSSRMFDDYRLLYRTVKGVFDSMQSGESDAAITFNTDVLPSGEEDASIIANDSYSEEYF